MKLNIYTDGGARGNPGPAAIGAVIKNEKGEVINSFGKVIGETTNNIAEYTAVVAALQWLRDDHIVSIGRLSLTGMHRTGEPRISFFLDSSLVVNQLNGLFKVKETKLRELLLKVRMLEQEMGGNVSYTYIPREKNWEADLLVNQALDNA